MNPAVSTTCPYCGVGCGVRAGSAGDHGATIGGDPEHPANKGRLCSKGMALGETFGLKTRLLHPMVRGQRASWDEALSLVARRFRDVIEEHGPDAVAFYVSGQLLTEDYYVANKLMKGFIGSANIDTNSRLCMSSAVAGHKRAFGADVVPGCYEDFECADLVVLAGSNSAWCHPILHQRLLAARAKRGTRIVVIDPRRTATCDEADLHLAIKPGTDVRLFNAALAHLADRRVIDRAFVDEHTRGLDAALKAAFAEDVSAAAVARDCGVATAEIEQFFDWLATTERTVTAFSQGVNQSAHGVDKVNAIINCHLLTGRIGKPGAGPFSLTGQPNAMGGREVGGLANQLAAHMDFDKAARRRLAKFWNTDRVAGRPGLKAVDMFRAVGEGRIRALWIMATNPAVSLPDANAVRAALAACEFVVVSDCVANTDTTKLAHVLLPASAWGEKEGTVTNSERCISRQRAFLPEAGEAKPDWWIVTQVARRMGFADAFPYSKPAKIFHEHAALSAFENGGARAFDIGALAEIGDEAYDAMQPVQWPVTHDRPDGTQRMFEGGRFFTPDGRARFVAIGASGPAQTTSAEFPFALNTGRIRDQWHTMTRTGLSPRLTRHVCEPFVEVNPQDAAAHRLTDGGLARVSTRNGAGVFRVSIEDGQQRGTLFVPIHWTDEVASAAVASRLVAPIVDPLSGQPEFKHTPAALEAFTATWHGFLLARDDMPPPKTAYWTRMQVQGGVLYEFAETDADVALPALDAFAGDAAAGGDRLEMNDRRRGRYRIARLEGGRLTHCLLATRAGALPPRDWLIGLLAAAQISDADRAILLAGRPAGDRVEEGDIVCSCFGVGAARIHAAIEGGGLATVDAVGGALKAGTNCGSCRPEIRALIAQALQRNAA